MEKKERTKEDFELLLKDFELYQTIWNEKVFTIPENYPNLFNGMTREEEVSEYRLKAVPPLLNLLNDGKIKSCEAKTVIEQRINNLKHQPPSTGRGVLDIHYFFNSTKIYPGETLTLKEIVNYLKAAVNGWITKNQLKILNNELDAIGTKACDPRASIDHELQDACSGLACVSIEAEEHKMHSSQKVAELRVG